MTAFEVSKLVFLELAVILAACRLVGWLVRPLGQPQVVAEMIAGVLLGPSLLGWLAPHWQAALFPRPAVAALHSAAQVGLALYMFLVGLEFDVDLIRSRVKSAVAVSWAGILTPFALGAALAWQFRGQEDLFAPGVRPWEAMLFMGAAMSITAFPMLARIIQESGLSGTSLGTLALAAGSADDAAAWCLLAVVLASFGGQPALALLTVAGALTLALATLLVGRPLLARAAARLVARDAAARSALPGALVLLMLWAWLADAIGVFEVFGAFLLGVAMPRGAVAERLRADLEPLTGRLLVPLFFVCSGLNTRVDLLAAPHAFSLAVWVLLAACLGKGLACYAAARLGGEEHREALAVGALMNARGMMELILLNIGLERGLISPLLFSILVVMAVVTTLMATPLFNRVYVRPAPRLVPAGAALGVQP